jgi:hypothetical protein
MPPSSGSWRSFAGGDRPNGAGRGCGPRTATGRTSRHPLKGDLPVAPSKVRVYLSAAAALCLVGRQRHPLTGASPAMVFAVEPKCDVILGRI